MYIYIMYCIMMMQGCIHVYIYNVFYYDDAGMYACIYIYNVFYHDDAVM